MSQTTPSQIECPQCGTAIDVNAVLAHKLGEELRQKFEADNANNKRLLEVQRQQLSAEKEKLESEKALQEEQVKRAVAQQLKMQSETLRQQIKLELIGEQQEVMTQLQNELNAKSLQVKELNKTKIEIEKLKREKDELRESLEAESEAKLTLLIAQEREKIQKNEAERNQLHLREKEKIIEQLKEQIELVKRKAEQGSMQLQGEVQELAIEEWLADHFPLDSIEAIKKGARGADCLQIVNTASQMSCGSIYYESKRTQNFQPLWIEKFKADIREKGADIGVLVTETMPADMNRLGLKEGVWICNFEEFKGLSLVLRESIIKTARAVAVQENRGDKMSMLYDYLTGNEFRMQVEAIVEGFTQLQSDLEKEKRSMTAMWKKREKQIEKVLLNTTHMYSSVQGIAGSAVKSLPILSLEDDDD